VGLSAVWVDLCQPLVEVVTGLGPVSVLPEKTRIALHARMSFAAFTPHIRWLDGHVVLAERLQSPVLHAFHLREPAEVDDEFVDWITRAYAVGQQHHVHPR
jgi:hypothetical protein